MGMLVTWKWLGQCNLVSLPRAQVQSWVWGNIPSQVAWPWGRGGGGGGYIFQWYNFKILCIECCNIEILKKNV